MTSRDDGCLYMPMSGGMALGMVVGFVGVMAVAQAGTFPQGNPAINAHTLVAVADPAVLGTVAVSGGSAGRSHLVGCIRLGMWAIGGG